MATFGEILRTLRKSRGLTQTELAVSIGRAQSEIYRWEKGIVRIPAEELVPLAQALGVAVERFFPDALHPTEEPLTHV